MLRIYKYPLEVDRSILIELPKDAKILTVQVQDNTPYIWAVVDDTQPPVIYNFRLFGTGHLIDIPRANLDQYIGTFQLNDGKFIGHLFQV